MADTEPAVEQPPQHGGGIKGFIKRIRPGEWALIAVGVVSLVVFYIWYQNNQNSNTTSSTTNPNPQWGSAQTGDSGTFAGEIADLLSQIASGAVTTPVTSANTVGSSNTSTLAGTSGTVNGSGVAGSAQGTGNATDLAGIVGTIDKSASSGSGLSQASNNQSPGSESAAAVVNSVNGTAGTTGNTGISLASIPGPALGTSTTIKVPANVTQGPTAATGATAASKTVAASVPKPPTTAPVRVVTSLPTVAPPKPAPVPAKVVTPTKAPVNVRPA